MKALRRTAIATSTVACVALLSFSWSEQRGVSLGSRAPGADRSTVDPIQRFWGCAPTVPAVSVLRRHDRGRWAMRGLLMPIRQAARKRSGPISPCSNGLTKMPSSRRRSRQLPWRLRRQSQLRHRSAMQGYAHLASMVSDFRRVLRVRLQAPPATGGLVSCPW
jgi:hypothetical protein